VIDVLIKRFLLFPFQEFYQPMPCAPKMRRLCCHVQSLLAFTSTPDNELRKSIIPRPHTPPTEHFATQFLFNHAGNRLFALPYNGTFQAEW
jgi:hypothetical protein